MDTNSIPRQYILNNIAYGDIKFWKLCCDAEHILPSSKILFIH